MNNKLFRPVFKKKIKIRGPVLFLVGPIGTFFARLSQYLEEKEIITYKISFPLFEYGFPKNRRINFDENIYLFKSFLEELLIERKIKHIFMYGNVLIPHQDALKVLEKLNRNGYQIQSHIFELGYLRPNFVTLEESGVNYCSNFILNKEFYNKQKPFEHLPIALKQDLRIRKIWKSITFIKHSFTNYKIVDFDHKLQPKPIYIWYQIKGFFLKYLFYLTEFKLKKDIFKNRFFIVILQVANDSQILKGSDIKNNYNFINMVVKNFSDSQLENTKLVFKHHPRDRGYNNYSNYIKKISKKFGIARDVFYIHDYPLSKIFRDPNCKGTVLINSTVGYQSLFHGVPLKSLGLAPYNIEGLCDQNNLKFFFKNPEKVDSKLFNKFYRYILENSQINGNFDGFFPFNDLFEFDK